VNPPRRRAPFRQIDVKRAVNGARAAGVAIGRVEIEGGKILIFPVDDSSPASDAAEVERRMREAFGE
jgi:hypothetical protein